MEKIKTKKINIYLRDKLIEMELFIVKFNSSLLEYSKLIMSL